MAAKHSPIRVQLIQHDKFEVLEQPGPFRVMREDAFVEHIGIAEDDMATRAYGRARVLWRIAVVGIDTNVPCAKRVCPLHQVVQLIVSESLRGIEVKRADIRIFQYPL